MTNAEVIRALSDEGLASYINNHSFCPPDMIDCRWEDSCCEDCWLKWLRKEAIGEANNDD